MIRVFQCIIALTTIMMVVLACGKSTGTVDGGNTPPQLPPPTASCASSSAKFSMDVNPIIQSSCASSSGCHGNGSINGPGSLTTFDQVRNAAASIKSAVTNKRMPLGGTLSSSQIQSISCWVDNGALNN
jgi:hypothetical protein